MLPERRPIDPEVKNMWRIAGTTGAVGIEIALCVCIGYFGGSFLDKKLGTTPWISYFGLAAGIGAAIRALVRVVRRYRRDLEKEPDGVALEGRTEIGSSGGFDVHGGCFSEEGRMSE